MSVAQLASIERAILRNELHFHPQTVVGILSERRGSGVGVDFGELEQCAGTLDDRHVDDLAVE